jgi:Fe2+ or Zn2+ uptake regulation protein
MTARDQRREVVASEIATYLAEHPDAADTVVGIRQWWLSRSSESASIATVRLALKELRRRGVVKATRVLGGGLIYSRWKDRC